MNGDQLTGINLFQALRIGREGAAIERSIRALSFLFHGWASFYRERLKTYEEPERGTLRVIAFTKLGRHFNTVWNCLFTKYIEEVKRILKEGTYDDLNEYVTFASPWNEIIGPHGRQPGRYESAKGPPSYMIDILFEMQKQGIMPYFQIVPPNEAPNHPAHPNTIIMRGMEDPDEEHFLIGFTKKEKEILKDWSYSLHELDGIKIRAIGTHVDLNETISDVCYEFKKGLPFCKGIIRSLEKNSCFLDDSYDLSRFAREANRKSRTNRNDYIDARNHMRDNIRIDELRQAFELSHKEDAEIWDSKPMSDLAIISRKAWAVARYAECVAYFRKNSNARTEASSKEGLRITHQWDECCAEVGNCGIQSLPKEVVGVFDGADGDIRPEVRRRMIEAMTDLNNKMNEMVKRFKYA